VIFGITGDLAKVMTFRSLYRLEQRGLIECPIVGVAVDDWTVDQLVERARESIVGTGEELDPTVFEPQLATNLTYMIQGLVVLLISTDVLVVYLLRLRKRRRSASAVAA
jgi:glucose-6-phosphate 1-dehydrogenase